MIQTSWWRLLNKTAQAGMLLLALNAAAQETAPGTYEEYRKRYADVNEIIISNRSSYDIFVENRKLRVLNDDYHESMILTEHGIQNNEESFTYSELIKLTGYEAYSIINDKGREKKIRVTQTNEKQSGSNSVFYDNVKERQLIFSNLEAGSRKVYSVKTEFQDPYLMHGFIFGSGYPIVNSTLEVRTDKNVNIGYKVFNDPGNTIEFTKSEKKGKYIYRWTVKEQSPVKLESNSPGFRYFLPHVSVYVKDYTVDGKTTPVLDKVDNLYDYYKGFIANLNKKEDPELKALAAEITSGAATDTEKVKRIFYWVKDNIKYIAFENGYEGFIPREAAMVFDRKYGDCKDMASIISAMAGYAGVKNVSVCWIGTRDIPYTYEELPTPAADNHMIAAYNDNGNYIFLDATDRETRYGIPTEFIQGKEALVSNGESYKVIKVPVVAATDNQTFESVKVKLENEKLSGTGTVSFTGYSRSNILAQIGDASDKRRFEMIKSLVQKGSNKFHLQEYKEANVKDREKPYEVNFAFDLADYAVQADKEVYINLSLDHPYEKMSLEADRVTDFDLEHLSVYNSRYELEIPANFSVKLLPENFTLDNELMKAESNYTVTGNSIVLATRIEIKKMMIGKAEFGLWNESVKKLKNNYSQTLILTRK